MRKSLLSALGLAVAFAFSMPALGNATATKTTAPAASTDTTMAAAPAKTAAKKPHKKVCKATKTHKCPVRHKKHAAKAAAPTTAAPKTSY
ncbi:hypothetical protein RFM26_10495 [Mesorhizobium sp. VK23B]|uniref:Acid shock protein n=1 Tax=Mesorhizobium dulcispinae TaxID=3072316 RepID=A0ABU4XDR3_9HYPH|nr:MULTISPECIES: hypothetical protein [unclassified Mesorhizobium]MDX8466109.1 hypothetical protein [Mesorhizobium sp. VK23B]MDX8471920.1 hypothetical protein [Mesorhizobium sp. VK23A]